MSRPLHSTEAEQSVLGALLLDNDAFDRIGDILDAGDFYTADHAEIYRATTAMIADGKPADAITVAEALKSAGKLEGVGGLRYIGELVANVPTAANIRGYATLVRERRIERDMVSAGERLVGLSQDREPIADRLDKAQSLVMTLTETAVTREARQIGEFLREAVDELERRVNEPAKIGLQTGLADLDEALTGLEAGQLVVIAGRPGMGKSVLANQIAAHAALNGTPAAVFSLEMSGVELATRQLAAASKLDGQKLRTARLQGDDWERLSAGLGKLQHVPLFIDDSADATVARIRAKARRLRRRSGIGLIVIDYLQLMDAPGYDSRREEVDAISRGCKKLAKELSVPLIAVAQLSRKCDERTNKRPLLSDLRESGGLEQDADVVLLLYRDEEYTKELSEFKGVIEIEIAKQRQGPTKRVYATWLGEQFAIGDRAAEWQSPAPKPSRRRGKPTLMQEFDQEQRT